MKKVLACVFALIMCFSLCSCGGGDTQTGGVPTLKMYMPADNQKDLAMVLEKANEIIEPKIGAKLDIQFIDEGAYSEKMNMIMSSGEAYDICFTGYLNKYSNAVSKGGLMELDELLETTPKLKEAVPDYLWDAVNYGGHIYAVPNEQINATKNVPFTFKELADKYGFDPESITSYPELEPYLAKIKEGEPNMIPYRLSSGNFAVFEDESNGFQEITAGFAIERNDPKAKVCFMYDRPEYIKGVEIRNEWLKKGYIRKDILSAGDDTTDYKSGRYAVWNAVYKPGVEADLTKQFGKEVVACKNVHKPYITNSSCTSTMLAISRTSKNPEAAIKLIELLNTDVELYNLLTIGIEGVHYNFNDEHKVVEVPNTGYEVASWKMGNQFNAYIPEGKDDNVWEETKELNETAQKSVIINFIIDTNPISTELSNASAVFDEYKFYIQGLTPDYKSHEAEYRAKLNKVGMDKIITELQRQVDEALANLKK